MMRCGIFVRWGYVQYLQASRDQGYILPKKKTERIDCPNAPSEFEVYYTGTWLLQVETAFVYFHVCCSVKFKYCGSLCQ